MFIPYGTNAPWLRPPVVTFSLIGLNTILFLLQDRLVPESIYVLEFGNGLHPVQWLWSAFAHANFCHLLGNMIFLFVFGSIVESRMTPVRFLILYVLTAVSESIIVQTLQFNGSGGALGASGVIYGLILVACLVKPDCRVNWFVVIWYRVYEFETPVLIAGLYYFLVDFGMALLVDFQISTPVLHVAGGLTGVCWGLVAFRLGWFIEDGKDLISRFNELLGKKPVIAVEPEVITPRPKESKFGDLEKVVAKLDQYLDEKRYKLALMKLNQVRQVDVAFRLDAGRLIKLINLGMHHEDWSRVVNWMGVYLKSFEPMKNEIRLKKAQIELMKMNRPTQAGKTLVAINRNELDQQQLRRVRSIEKRVAATNAGAANVGCESPTR